VTAPHPELTPNPTESLFEPLSSFDSFSEDIRKGIADLGWRTPMEVQRRVVPVMRAGRDLIAQAVTGSGKTGAFGLSSIERIDPELHVPQLLVLAPTRELALQIEKEVATMGRHRGVETIAVYGGTAYGPQLDAFARGVHAVVGTPGRLLDHLESRRLDLRQVRVLIFDEADELLSLGFWPDMREIQKYLPRRRITGLFSATMPQRVMSLARVFLDDPVFVSLVKPGDSAPPEIEHWHYIVSAHQKDKELLRILRYEDPDSAIIFCNTRADVRYLTAFLQRNHMDADMIQGEMTQAAREAVMRRIKAGELRFLVATDVAARGIDISDLSHVISYAAPESPEMYLHRTGRTGRAGKRGTAISLVSGLDVANFRYLQQVNRMEIPERPLPSDEQVAQRTLGRLEIDLEHELRGLDERERRLREEVHLPLVEKLGETPEGRRKLAAVLFQWLDHRHVPAPEVEEPIASTGPSRPTPGGVAPAEAPAKRRRRRRRRSRQAGAE
jgi:ATP-dependent RNA helicase DeaD